MTDLSQEVAEILESLTRGETVTVRMLHNRLFPANDVDNLRAIRAALKRLAMESKISRNKVESDEDHQLLIMRKQAAAAYAKCEANLMAQGRPIYKPPQQQPAKIPGYLAQIPADQLAYIEANMPRRLPDGSWTKTTIGVPSQKGSNVSVIRDGLL